MAMKRIGFWLPVFSILCLGTACADDKADTGGDETDDSDTGTDTGDGDGDGDGDPEPVPAKGIGITDVYVNQGVPITIVKNGAWAGPTDRDRAIIQGRQSLVQAMWHYEPGWEFREIEARLILDIPGEEEPLVGISKIMVEHEAQQRIGDSFWWVLPPELMVPNIKFKVELWEVEPGHEDDPDPGFPNVAPADGNPNWVGVEDSYMNIKVMLVPIKHELDGENCTAGPVIDESAAENFRKALAEYNPVDKIEIEVRDEVVYTNPMSSFGGVLQYLASLRQQDSAPPEYYYYGLVRPCDGGADGVGGQAISIPQTATKGNSATRVAMGRWYGPAEVYSPSTGDTFVHEIGHTQGRYHVDCGGAGGPDPAYPHAGGNTETWGFANETFASLPPTFKDYMSYCGPTWVSDYGWDLVFPRIKLIAGWDLEGPDQGDPEIGTVLYGLLGADGEEHWFTSDGYVTPEELTQGETLQLTTANGVHDLPAVVYDQGDSTGITVAVELPAEIGDLSSVTDAVRFSDELTIDLDVDAIRTAP